MNKSYEWILFAAIFALLCWTWLVNAQAPSAPSACPLTYDNFGKAFVQSYCVRCHDSAKKGWFARSGAPKDFNYDTSEGIMKVKDDIINRTIVKKNMPPSGPMPTDEERGKLNAWLSCEVKP